MTTESRRHDLYNGLTEVLGQERADTLMSHLPTHQYDDLATKSDIDALSTRIDEVESSLSTRIDNVESRLSARVDNLGTRSDSLRNEMVQRFDAVNSRIDRLVITVAAGLFAIIATMISQSIF